MPCQHSYAPIGCTPARHFIPAAGRATITHVLPSARHEPTTSSPPLSDIALHVVSSGASPPCSATACVISPVALWLLRLSHPLGCLHRPTPRLYLVTTIVVSSTVPQNQCCVLPSGSLPPSMLSPPLHHITHIVSFRVSLPSDPAYHVIPSATCLYHRHHWSLLLGRASNHIVPSSVRRHHTRVSFDLPPLHESSPLLRARPLHRSLYHTATTVVVSSVAPSSP